MKYISRHMENRILELSKSYSAILLTGPRQAGKTTMLRELAEKENIGRRYVTLDNLSERDLAKNDPALFLQLHKPGADRRGAVRPGAVHLHQNPHRRASQTRRLLDDWLANLPTYAGCAGIFGRTCGVAAHVSHVAA